MNDDRLIEFRISPKQPFSYAILSRLDAEAINQFVESNERPTILLPGPRPTFALCEFLRAAPPGPPRTLRVQRAVEWIARHGRPIAAWKSWTVEMPPAVSDYDEPERAPTPTIA